MTACTGCCHLTNSDANSAEHFVKVRFSYQCRHRNLEEIVQVKSHTIFGAVRRENIIWVLWMAKKCPSLAIRLIVVYQPTYSREHTVSSVVFNQEFGEYLQGVAGLILGLRPANERRRYFVNLESANLESALEWHCQKSSFWLQEISIFMLMVAQTRMLQNANIYCLNLDYNNMYV